MCSLFLVQKKYSRSSKSPAVGVKYKYTTDLKIFYYENLNIYESIQEIREENETPKTVRVYKLMYNEHPIYGTYTINLKNVM